MKGRRAAVRYAKALQQLSQEKNLLDAVVSDMKLVQGTIKGSKDLALMLQSPLVKTQQKREVLRAIFQSKVNEVSFNFINQVTSQGRERILSMICEEFINLYNQLKNIAKVSVSTSVPLTADLKTELLALLKSSYHFSEVELEEKVDSTLIGGLVLRIGDKQLDASIRRKLNDIKQELIHA
jgi:F-type H+-transporting ATPase subunit delta